MELFKQHCRLCGDIKSNENVEIIDNMMKDIFCVLLLKLTFDNETQDTICNVCSSKVLAALNFKSACIYTDDTIIPFIDLENAIFVDLKAVYAKEQGRNEIDKMLENQGICRLCLQPITGEPWPVQEVPGDSIQTFIPEINFDVSADPVICSRCLDSLFVHSTFLKQCLVSQDKMDIKENVVDTTLLINSCIKTEEIEIKSEEIDEERYKPLHTPRKVIDIKIESEDSLDDLKRRETTVQSLIPKYKCAKCEYETTSTRQFARHELRHKINSDVQVGRQGGSSKRRTYSCHKRNQQLNCGNASKKQMRRREKSDYKTEKCNHLKGDQLVQMDPSVVQRYKCEERTVETKRKGDLTVHQLMHKDPSKVKTYKCYSCTFKTTFRENLKRHLIKHKDPSQVQTYKCASCAYETVHKRDLISHLRIHKDPSKVQMYKVQMYKCDKCQHEFKYKNSLKNHLLIHKDPSKVEMYKCDKCTVETKRKADLTVHQLTHKDSSQVKMYKCSSCTFETIYRKNLNRHLTMHKDPSEMNMYKCDKCKFETKHKYRLKEHMLKHKDPSEVQMYKCASCTFQTKYKGDLVKHLRKHKDQNSIYSSVH